MTTIVWLFLLIHIIVTIIYTLIIFIKNRTLGICRGVVVLMIPAIGLLSYLIMDLLSFFDGDQAYFNQDDLMLKMQKSNYIQKPNETEELNTVPIFEVLSINNNTDKRRVLLDFLKVDHSNMEGFNDFMLESLHSGDSETTHYIASYLFEFSRERTNNLRNIQLEYQQNSEDILVIQKYIKVVLDYIENERLTEENLKRYIQSYIEAINKLVNNHSYILMEEDLKKVVEVYIKAKDYSNALKWCHTYMSKFPMSETPYVLKMDINFRLKNNEEFTKNLKELMASNIQLSNSTWNLVRHWSSR
jgi:hypothetical protein